jgi:ketosteroid isomerase-like protein
VPSGVLAGESSAQAPDGTTGNYRRSHTVLVYHENQGGWLMIHDYVAYIWLTASEQYVVFIPSMD